MNLSVGFCFSATVTVDFIMCKKYIRHLDEVMGWCKSWTLESRLDSWTGLWTDIWTGFQTEKVPNDDLFRLYSQYLGEESCDQDWQWTQSITVAVFIHSVS